jgi:hypothetical protein
MVEILKRLSSRQIVVRQNNKFYLVSQSNEAIQPVETLIFECDESGKVETWNEIGGAIGYSLESFIPMLLEHGVHYKDWDDFPW